MRFLFQASLNIVWVKRLPPQQTRQVRSLMMEESRSVSDHSFSRMVLRWVPVEWKSTRHLLIIVNRYEFRSFLFGEVIIRLSVQNAGNDSIIDIEMNDRPRVQAVQSTDADTPRKKSFTQKEEVLAAPHVTISMIKKHHRTSKVGLVLCVFLISHSHRSRAIRILPLRRHALRSTMLKLRPMNWKRVPSSLREKKTILRRTARDNLSINCHRLGGLKRRICLIKREKKIERYFVVAVVKDVLAVRHAVV